MKLQTLFRVRRKSSVANALASVLVAAGFLSFHTSVLAQGEPESKERYELDLSPKIHEARQRMITDPATSGDIKDYYLVRKMGFEAWRNMGRQLTFAAPQAEPAWKMVTATGSQSGHTSGRARSIAFHPTDPNTVWVATAQGGIWKTTEVYADAPKWVNLSENLPTLAMGAIAVDPTNPNIIFAGTGETNGGYSTPNGQGLFRSTNGGLDWKLVLAPDSGATKAGAGYNCSQIVIDPKDPKRIYVATANTHGLVRSTDGGDSWTRVPNNVIGNLPCSIAMNPDETNRLYVSGMSGKVYRTTDYGETWTQCTLASLGNSQRIQVALSNSSPNIIYAAVLTSGSAASVHSQIYRSEDHGVTWTLQCDATAEVDDRPELGSKKVDYLWNSSQGNYAHALAIDPNNGNMFAGGYVIVFSSASDKGQNLTTRTSNQNPTQSNYVHADCQYLAFNSDGKLFALTDGGISYTSGSGTQWTNKANTNIGTLQFVGADADRAFTFVVGGTQDNGTNKATVETAPNWKEVRGGDGGLAKVAQEDPSIVYGTSVGNDLFPVIFRSQNFGESFGENIICNTNTALRSGLEFYPKYDISANGNVIAVASGSTVYVDAGGGSSCFPIKGKVGSGTMGTRPRAVHVAPYDDYKIWAASSKNIFWSEDGGENYTKVTVSGFAGDVSDIISDPSNSQLVYAVSSGVSKENSNFASSKDGGKTWQMPATDLPAIPAWSVAKAKNGTIFIGTDFGVLYSKNDGVTWIKLGQGLPMSQVLSLEVRGTNEQWLLAGTFGRGAYYIDITNLSGVKDVASHAEQTITLGKTYPNPATAAATEAKLDFSLKNAGIAQVILHDIQGREVMTLAKDYFDAGSHSVSIPVSTLDAGTYFYSLTSDGQTLTDKLVVTK